MTGTSHRSIRSGAEARTETLTGLSEAPGRHIGSEGHHSTTSDRTWDDRSLQPDVLREVGVAKRLVQGLAALPRSPDDASSESVAARKAAHVIEVGHRSDVHEIQLE